MRIAYASLMLLVSAWCFGAETMEHPVTKAEGFWLSRPEMEYNVVLLQERDFLSNEREKLLLMQESFRFERNAWRAGALALLGLSVALGIMAAVK